MNRKFESLVITRWRPDRPAGGAALRNWQNIQALAALGPVDVLSIGAEATPEKIPGVREWIPLSLPQLMAERSFFERVKRRFWFFRPTVHPSIELYRHHKAYRIIRKRCLHYRYNLGVIEELSLAPYLQVLKEGGCQVVYDAHNVESVLRAEIASAGKERKTTPWTRLKSSILKRQITAEEKRVVQGSDLLWACSKPDSESLKTIYHPRAAITSVPNGVDVNNYRFPGALDPIDTWTGPVTLLYLGSFSYFPNVEAALTLAKDVLPRLQKSNGEARVILVGKNPHPSMTAASRDNSSVQVTGAVESVLPYLAMPCIVTLPITTGSGTRLKILEAFAARRPVVSTRKGAEGIEGEDGKHLLLRDSPEEISQAALDLWRNKDLRKQLCENAFDLVRDKYSWTAAAVQIYRSLECATTMIDCREAALSNHEPEPSLHPSTY